jgi:hypothetical protein
MLELASNVFGAYGSVPLLPGIRNQYNAGLQQSLGRHLLSDADYFWKYTRNAYDLDNVFTTAIYFPNGHARRWMGFQRGSPSANTRD